MNNSKPLSIEEIRSPDEPFARKWETCAICGQPGAPVCGNCNRRLGMVWFQNGLAAFALTCLWLLGARTAAPNLGMHVYVLLPICGTVWINGVLLAGRLMKKRGQYIVGETVAEAWALGTVLAAGLWLLSEIVMALR